MNLIVIASPFLSSQQLTPLLSSPLLSSQQLIVIVAPLSLSSSSPLSSTRSCPGPGSVSQEHQQMLSDGSLSASQGPPSQPSHQAVVTMPKHSSSSETDGTHGFADKLGFDKISEEQIPECKSLAVLYKHRKTGAEIMSVSTDDENKVFGIVFRTPPNDSTGIPHILEHSVLCGSRKYPLKEPFVELLKGSLNTFLNAFTYPDRTCYPVASTNTEYQTESSVQDCNVCMGKSCVNHESQSMSLC